jgi:hypothetical protein
MWNDLTLNEKAELIKLAVNNGITDLNTIRDTYNKFEEGGPLDEKNTPKVGPTYDETSKRWINPYGKDITGQSFDGDYGVTTYYDTGAVEFVPFGKEPVYRYASNAPRKYIGGSTIEARQKYYDVDKEFTDNVKRMADKYGISANTLASRIAKEGPIDEAINNYNNTNGYLQRGKLLGPVWGLDDLGTLIHEGTVKVNPEMELFTDVEMENEKGRTTYSVASDNYLDGVEITAAALSYYKNEMKKRFPNSSNDRLEQLATAAFNMGVSRAVELAKEGKIVNTYKPFINIKASGGPLWGNYNKYAKGGNLEDPEKEWKALNNINFEAIPDTTFTRDKTGVGDIEYFNPRYPGIRYPNGYYREHPSPGKHVILYNPNNNDMQDVRLDALHIMPEDATYDVLNTLYREAARGTDVEWNARRRYEEDARKYGATNIDPYESYFNNEADGLLRNMFIEGTPEYIKSKHYYPDKKQLEEWNKPLLGYINEIRKYLETGERPQYILPEVVITPKK